MKTSHLSEASYTDSSCVSMTPRLPQNLNIASWKHFFVVAFTRQLTWRTGSLDQFTSSEPSQRLRSVPFRIMVSSEELWTKSTPWWNLRNSSAGWTVAPTRCLSPGYDVPLGCRGTLRAQRQSSQSGSDESCDLLSVRFTQWRTLAGRRCRRADVFHPPLWRCNNVVC